MSRGKPRTRAIQVEGDGDGLASVKLKGAQMKDAKDSAARLHSDETENSTTGADLGAGPGAGRTKDVSAS
jgi:Mn-containing catalase